MITMTSLLTGEPVKIEMAPLIQEDCFKYRRYSVDLVHKATGDHFEGWVVTDIDINHWCENNGYRLMILYPDIQFATPDDKTNLW